MMPGGAGENHSVVETLVNGTRQKMGKIPAWENEKVVVFTFAFCRRTQAFGKRLFILYVANLRMGVCWKKFLPGQRKKKSGKAKRPGRTCRSGGIRTTTNRWKK
jgi:hypothetical protein